MSTLEVACPRCDRRFRVRAEFAGKTTRCPGCSAPITIGGSKAPPPRDDRPERPAPRPRPRDDEDDRPSRPAGDWRPVDSALGREQVAVVFVLLTILDSYLVYCLGNAAGGPSGPLEGVLIVVMLLLLAGPSLVAAVFGVTARVAAIGAPAESLAKGSAVASLLCGFAGLVALVMLGITLLAGLDRHGPPEAPTAVATGGLAIATLGALVTFLGFVAQVGIARRSDEVSAAVGRAAVAVCACVVGLIGIGVLYALASEVAAPPPPGAFGGGFSARPDHSTFFQVVTGFLFPLAFAVVLILYHRLLAAARRAVRD